MYSSVGCGRSVHGFAAIAKAADVLVDFTHDMHLLLLADMAALGTHEQTVLYQTAKLCTFPAHDAEDLMFKDVPDVVSGTCFLFGFRRLFRFRASPFSGR